jgi:hypothetical protein
LTGNNGGTWCQLTTEYTRPSSTTPPESATATPVNGGNNCGGRAKHREIHDRIRTLFNIHATSRDLYFVEWNGRITSFTTTFPWGPSGAGTTAGGYGIDVRCQICAYYDGLFPAFFNRVKVCAESVGPYLEG